MTMAQYFPAVREQTLCTNDSGAAAFVLRHRYLWIQIPRSTHVEVTVHVSGNKSVRATRRAVPGGRK